MCHLSPLGVLRGYYGVGVLKNKNLLKVHPHKIRTMTSILLMLVADIFTDQISHMDPYWLVPE